uniref:Uncharacterized protein n=1 Tax=Schistosoma haematobium TaxID=6185 RepID=A0A095AHN7_SCHHA
MPNFGADEKSKSNAQKKPKNINTYTFVITGDDDDDDDERVLLETYIFLNKSKTYITTN